MKNLKILSILILAVSLFSFQGVENEKDRNTFDLIDSAVVNGYTKAKVIFAGYATEEYKQEIRDQFMEYYGPFRVTECTDESEIWEWRFPVNWPTGETDAQAPSTKKRPMDDRPGYQVIWDNNASC